MRGRLRNSPAPLPWVEEEDEQLLLLYGIHGNKWTLISKIMEDDGWPRTSHACASRHHTLQKQKACSIPCPVQMLALHRPWR